MPLGPPFSKFDTCDFLSASKRENLELLIYSERGPTLLPVEDAEESFSLIASSTKSPFDANVNSFDLGKIRFMLIGQSVEWIGNGGAAIILNPIKPK